MNFEIWILKSELWDGKVTIIFFIIIIVVLYIYISFFNVFFV